MLGRRWLWSELACQAQNGVLRAQGIFVSNAMKEGEMQVCQRRFEFQLVVFARRPPYNGDEQCKKLRRVDPPCPVDAAC